MVFSSLILSLTDGVVWCFLMTLPNRNGYEIVDVILVKSDVKGTSDLYDARL